MFPLLKTLYVWSRRIPAGFLITFVFLMALYLVAITLAACAMLLWGLRSIGSGNDS